MAAGEAFFCDERQSNRSTQVHKQGAESALSVISESDDRSCRHGARSGPVLWRGGGLEEQVELGRGQDPGLAGSGGLGHERTPEVA